MNNEVLDQLFSPTFCLDKTLTLSYFNPSMSTLLQLPPRKIKEKAIHELLPLGEKFWKELLEHSLKQKVAISEEVDFFLAGVNYTFVFRMMKQDDGTFLVFTNDLSVEKTLHSKYREQVELLKRSHQQVVQADKVRAIGELTAGISHEINNPLTVASGNTELLGFALENENIEEQREIITQCVNNVDEALARIESIISGMKGFLHQGSEDKKEYVDLSGVIENSINLTQGTIDAAEIEVITKFPKGTHVVLGNKTRLEQIIINLLNNAADSLVESRVDDPRITIQLKRDPKKHMIHLIVSDNGLGVNEEIHEQIFENFFTTKEMGVGTGLGLSLCRKIAEDHQGTLEYLPGREGAVFQLSLPVIEVSSFANNDEIFSKLNDIHGKKILVVDNDVTILNLCQKFMEKTAFIFIGSTGGEEALDVLNKYDIDAVITDLNMPGIDGNEFVSKLRVQYGSVPVFYLSDVGGMEQYQKDKEALRLSGMLVKPFKAHELVSLLEETFKK